MARDFLRRAPLYTLILLAAAWLFIRGCGVQQGTGGGGFFGVDNIHFEAGKSAPERSSKKFLPGETVWIRFDLHGARIDSDDRIRGIEEAHVIAPDGRTTAQIEKTFNVSGEEGSALRCDYQVILPVDAAPGRYRVEIVMRDTAGSQMTRFSDSFTVASK